MNYKYSNIVGKKLSGNKALVFVGGYGDDELYYSELLKDISRKTYGFDIYGIGFSKKVGAKNSTLNTQAKELKDFIRFLADERSYHSFVLFCTSDGAYSLSYLVSKSNLANKIDKAVFLDPCDYYIKQGNDYPWSDIWKGFVNYNPKSKTCSKLLCELTSKTVIYVVNFTLRNYTKMGYPEPKYRGIDNNEYFPRLSNKMVKSFYTNTPLRNRGAYIEINTIPHAFNRDGNTKKSREVLVDLTTKLIKER